jgi:hypothetical protein
VRRALVRTRPLRTRSTECDLPSPRTPDDRGDTIRKPTDVLVRDEELESLKARVAHLERTCTALSSRMLALFGPVQKHVDVAVAGAQRPVGAPAAR